MGWSPPLGLVTLLRENLMPGHHPQGHADPRSGEGSAGVCSVNQGWAHEWVDLGCKPKRCSKSSAQECGHNWSIVFHREVAVIKGTGPSCRPCSLGVGWGDLNPGTRWSRLLVALEKYSGFGDYYSLSAWASFSALVLPRVGKDKKEDIIRMSG